MRSSHLFALIALLPAAVAFSPGTILQQLTGNSASKNTSNKNKQWPENGRDENYPWCFTGRLWFRPALVNINDESNSLRPPSSVSVLNVFGWTIGGTVALEYDTSPVGPYREYVTMGAVVSKRGALGQWGSRLYVSNQVAEDVCQDVWKVPAQVADIEFEEDPGQSLSVDSAPTNFGSNPQQIRVKGWSNTRVLTDEELANDAPGGNLPVYWTPTIKALWAPIIPLPAISGDKQEDNLPLHRLRLSAGALRLRFCPQTASDALGVPIGIGLVVDNVLIEISRQDGEL